MSTTTKSNETTGPWVSVVVAGYNAERTIEATLAGALAQTFRDLEVIVVDDGSADRSRDIVRRLAETDARLSLVEQANAGPSAARNRGVEIGCGEIVACLDADDLWLPQHLELCVAMLDAYPGVGVCFAPCEIIDGNGRLTGEKTRVRLGPIEFREVLAGNPTATCSALVMRREAYREIGAMRSDMSYAEDQEWLFRAVASRWKVQGIADYTVRYRVTTGSLSADTRRMLAGWNAFLAHARGTAPDVVAANLSYATWHMRLYHARRAIQGGQSARIACGHLAEGIAAAPGLAVRSPVKTLALAGACLVPGVARGALSLARMLRHG